MNKLPRIALGLGLAGVLIGLAACQQAPQPVETPEATTDYCARMVTNSGGLDDRSFNQSTWEGLQQAEKTLGIEATALVSTNETDLSPNVQQAVESGCQMVVTVGWELAEATATEAAANPDTHFVIVDEVVDAPNVKPLVFQTAEASYLAGYLAAGVSKTGIVATFGGDAQPPVTLFMDGFVGGVAAYNAAHGTDVRALGWNAETQQGSFTGDYEDVSKGKTLAQGFIDQGADVILPVAAQVGEGAAAAALDNGNVMIIWVDNDGFETLPSEYRSIVLTSVLKNTGTAIQDIVSDDLAGQFTSDAFIGTLKNQGVDIAPYHDQAVAVSEELGAEIDQLRQDIISGAVLVESPSAL
ncbi:BMP family ABC transporter substrate-binding protein [Klugiella xanthotipulae]|uniref:Nucleoside-binding protein n=1 Tax=Klugiella xanthotipulae TaxID=244735 RepID=A0A543HYM8_9MICO|nr:BMP family ABC transporter substrate-binding protein [Klugiella xanthotipulae]TQM63447.1 nucleoside-binding protein [Klugiella xanthotipulae]